MPNDDPLPSTFALASFEELHSLYARRIFTFLYSTLRDRDLAETLTQETFLKAWLARDSFRGDSGVRAWLTTIALNLVRDHTNTNRFRFWKKAVTQSVDAHGTLLADQLRDTGASAESSLIARQQVELLWQKVATLSEAQRTVFILRFVEELDIADIAQITRLPMSTVKSHLYRGLAAVRKAN